MPPFHLQYALTMHYTLSALMATLYTVLVGSTLRYGKEAEHYEVVGVSCEDNEVVSCLLIKCSNGDNCPAEKYCYNPECVCRRGYRRVRGVCVRKHITHNLDSEALTSALLETNFDNRF